MLRKVQRYLKLLVLGILSPRGTRDHVRDAYHRRHINQQRRASYRQWFGAYLAGIDSVKQAKEIEAWKHQPLISIVVPLYNTPHRFLKACIKSVLAQSYSNWEICFADDASTNACLNIIKAYAARDDRFKFVRLTSNQHITGASNEALKLATGQYVALLDHDDILTPNALFEVVKAINQDPSLDLIYSDEDKFEEGKGHLDPFFKPDWSPDFLRSCNYITHFAVLRRQIVNRIGGFRLGTEGAQDWDLFLRFTEETDRIYHVPKILYSWRISVNSTAKTAETKPYAYINQLRVLRDAVRRERLTGSVRMNKYLGFWAVDYDVQGTPLVSIIIPTKNQLTLLKRCLESIIELSSYPYFEIILVDTGSTDQAVSTFYNSNFCRNNNIQVARDAAKEFNFSRACNLGVAKSKGDYLLFLNNDTEVITKNWIERLLGLAQRNSVGMVGAKLLFPNKLIQHAGVVLSQQDIAFHPFYGQNSALDIFTNIYISNIRNVSAVTAACAIVNRQKFQEVGGFDEGLAVTYNDVDLCLKLLKAGYRNIYTPRAELFHHESVSVGRISTKERDSGELAQAQQSMQERWAEWLKRDPYYNDNYIQVGPGYELPTD